VRPLRFGLVGCGRIAERGYLPAAHDVSSVEFVAFADSDVRRARAAFDFDRPVARSKSKALDREGAFATVEELVAAGGVEALVVATPAESHQRIATLAAQAGLPALVEKPPAPDLAGALGLASLYPAPSLGFNRRFLQGLDLAPRIPAEGWLELELELCFRRGGWGAHVSRDEALLDAGTHLIDLAAFLSGSTPIAVRGAELSQERASLELELGRGRARLRCRTDARFAERVVVRDRAGRALASSTIGLRARLARLRGSPDPIVLSLRRQLEAFAARVRQEDGGALASAEDGAVAMAVVAAARRSAELGGAEVTVDRPPAPSPESIA
jgi:predicted dehydrogenase